jgi:hypothetical protein
LSMRFQKAVLNWIQRSGSKKQIFENEKE